MNDFKKPISEIVPLTDSQLNKMYVSGAMRNLQSVIASVYGDEVRVKSGTRTRGEYSFEILAHLFRTSRIGDVCRRVLRSLKNNKQGNISYHDLAIAHCLLCVLQHLEFGKHDRHSVVFASSPVLGRVVVHLRKLTKLVFSKYTPRQFSLLSEIDIESEFQQPCCDLATSLQKAFELNAKSKAKKFHESQFSLPKLIAAFALIKAAGLDDRPFDEFLEV